MRADSLAIRIELREGMRRTAPRAPEKMRGEDKDEEALSGGKSKEGVPPELKKH